MFNCHKKETVSGLSGLLMFLLLTLCIYTTRAESGELVGQGSDGNRSMPTHRIELYSADGVRIRSFHQNPQPFSTRQTCGRCHDYNKIASGWHFNGHDSEVDPGRPGHPWVLTDNGTRTQVPISGRQWPGAFTPEQLGLSPWEFVNQNFGHFPGGSYGEMEAEHPYDLARQDIGGKYEINCLACHNADSYQDQNEAALQAARENYRWIPAASSQMAVVNGVAAEQNIFYDSEFDDETFKVTYKDGLFDAEDMAFFDITGEPLNARCYFCHSSQNLSVGEDQEWTRDEDVHLAAGINCVDCHRNGDDHMITRGIEAEGLGQTLTCEGCHVSEHHAEIPVSGRLGAPEPAHRGIPAIHFEKLTCTACHSGPWPKEEAGRWRTARMHKTGLHGKHNLEITQPHVYAPILMKGADGKIGPHKVFWPAYWATVPTASTTLTGEEFKPIAPKDVLAKAKKVLSTDVEKEDDWKPLTEQQIAEVLKQLGSEEADAVYIAGGKLYRLNAKGGIESQIHAVAEPYAWPMAHDVRPAEQALGVRKCKDCHTTDSAFFFGTVQMDSAVKSDGGPDFVEMIKLQRIDRLYMWAFNFSFVFRPFLKIVAFAACGLIGLVLLTYVLRAVAAFSGACAKEDA